MPANKEALIRYRVINTLLTRRGGKLPTMDDFQEACLDVLGYEVSQRTLQDDIRAMKQDEGLGYLAPIVYDRSDKGFRYTDPDYTIDNIPITQGDLDALHFALSVLDQYRELGILKQFGGAVEKLDRAIKLNRFTDGQQERPFIELEQAPHVEGLEHLDPLVLAIQERHPVELQYRSFVSGKEKNYLLHPYLLKEYKNRWYLIGLNTAKDQIATFGLDRIVKVTPVLDRFEVREGFDAASYFRHSFGITYSSGKPQKVVLKFAPRDANYVRTQPLHQTQRVIKDNEEGLTISLQVYLTYELTSTILSYGAGVEVLEPEVLRDEVSERLVKAGEVYKI